MFEIKGKYNKAKVFASRIDEATTAQILELCNQEWAKDSKIAIMPDTHAGKGCTIGTTMTISDKVCPNLVGVDISCGMLTVQMPKSLNDFSLKELDDFITQNIPSGFLVNQNRVVNLETEGVYLKQLKCFEKLKNIEYLELSLGSLGSGNHFIEVDIDDEDNKYLVIHTGSRNLGKQVAEYYQNLAFEDCNQQKAKRKKALNELIQSLISEGRQKEIQTEIEKFNQTYKEELVISKDLCYLKDEHLEDYLNDMKICQEFARLNRKYIAVRIIEHLIKEKFGSVKIGQQWKKDGHILIYGTDLEFKYFETVHNYIDLDNMILRKGAISAQKGEIVLIPINMRDGAIIGIGKGNPEYNFSGPHGAGRLLSRSEAKETISLENFKNSMTGIYTSSVAESTIDESPMAYKTIEDILENIIDSIEIKKIIKPIYNFKAH